MAPRSFPQSEVNLCTHVSWRLVKMFCIKICGVTRVDDALEIAKSGADAIGLNFYDKSPRSVSPEKASEISAALGDASGVTPLLVGVFVNATSEHITGLIDSVPLGAVQLHGDEPAEFVRELPTGTPVIRAVRMGEQGLTSAADFARRCEAMGRPLSAVLVDAAPAAGQAEAYGGTGRTVDWKRVATERSLLGPIPVILAGGLRPANVAEAIAAAKPDGVDTASGVETAPGEKDPAEVASFVRTAKAALSTEGA